MGYAVATLAFSKALKQFANLEKEHHEHCLGELCFCTRQESDAQCTYRGDRHKQVFVEHVTTDNAFRRLFQRTVSYEQIRHEVDKQQLPCSKRATFFYHHCHGKQYRRCNDKHYLVTKRPFAVMMKMVVVSASLTMTVSTTMSVDVTTVCHNLVSCFYFMFCFIRMQRYEICLATKLHSCSRLKYTTSLTRKDVLTPHTGRKSHRGGKTDKNIAFY